MNPTPSSAVSSTLAASAASSAERPVQPLPPWVKQVSEDDEDLLLPPPQARYPTHHGVPHQPDLKKPPGKRFDHLRTLETPIITTPFVESAPRLRAFIQASAPPEPKTQHYASPESEAAYRRWWEDFNQDVPRPSAHPLEVAHNEKQQNDGVWLLSWEGWSRAKKHAKHVLLKNPLMPLVLRLIVLTLTAAALGIGANLFTSVKSINSQRDNNERCEQRSSSYMAIIVDAFAIPYLGYVTWDEYMSPPLGLRPVSAKLSLIFLDLVFVVFDTANMSLAIDALRDPLWACYADNPQFAIPTVRGSTCPLQPGICGYQKGLSGVLFVALVAWLATFATSVFR
ncbi:hypothetical protein BJ546DRAFT_211322 [Cryomyces antarcticus]